MAGVKMHSSGISWPGAGGDDAGQVRDPCSEDERRAGRLTDWKRPGAGKGRSAPRKWLVAKGTGHFASTQTIRFDVIRTKSAQRSRSFSCRDHVTQASTRCMALW